MKDFIVYMQPKLPDPPRKEKYSVEELKSLPSSSSIYELGVVKDGDLTLLRQTENLQVFNFSGQFQLPKPQAAEEVAYVQMTFDIWQQRKGHFVASFKAPKKLSRVAIALLSLATHNDPFLISSVQITKGDFISLTDYILKCGGDIRQYIFWNSRGRRTNEARVDQSRKSGLRLEENPDFKKDFKTFQKIRLLGYSFKPSLESRDIRFRMIDWGGGQFYSPADPFDHEILDFLELFEKTIIPRA